MSKHVTSTGRALSRGTVTRKSLSVRRRQKGVSPLPVELQCHPKALTKTSLNPGCYEYNNWAAHGVDLAANLSRNSFIRGKELKKAGRYELANTSDGRAYGYTDDINLAKAWQHAAKIHGIPVDILTE